MPIDRRSLLLGSLSAATLAAPGKAAPLSSFGLDAAHFGVRPGAPDDQSAKLQRAIDDAARRRIPLLLAPGVYRAGDLKLSTGSQILGVRGATRLVYTHGPSLLSGGHADTVRKSGNNGIQVWQSDKRYDGTLVADNRVEDTYARAGGNGQNGNAISVFRAGNVIVRGNHIRNAAFTAIRGNSASDIQIIGNNCTGLDDVAIYSEFGFQGAVIADNLIDGTMTGISVTNFDYDGRLATVRGNIVRNLHTDRPAEPGNGNGIGVEADTVVSGNVVEGAPRAGIAAGWGPAMRNLAVTGNVVRKSAMGVAVSVVKGGGVAVIANNIFTETVGGAIVGMEWQKKVSGDLALAGAARYPNLRISGNQVN